MKETSMQWLENELVNSNLKMPLITGLKVFALIKKAKEIERTQIVKAYDKGEFNSGCNETSEQYYVKTYK